nr:MAG TPA: protein of unknown function (DUF4234) [Caudoviricetes sp.]
MKDLILKKRSIMLQIVLTMVTGGIYLYLLIYYKYIYNNNLKKKDLLSTTTKCYSTEQYYDEKSKTNIDKITRDYLHTLYEEKDLYNGYSLKKAEEEQEELISQYDRINFPGLIRKVQNEDGTHTFVIYLKDIDNKNYPIFIAQKKATYELNEIMKNKDEIKCIINFDGGKTIDYDEDKDKYFYNEYDYKIFYKI